MIPVPTGVRVWLATHRHAKRLPVAVLAGPGGLAARSFERPPFLLSRTQGRPVGGDLA
jgi:hypothetical protein